jgi:peptidyl-prolyl cis-trans isomerase C
MSLILSHLRVLAIACGLAAAALGTVFPAAADEGDDPVVAILNGEDIHLSEVEALRGQLPDQYKTMPIEFVFPFLLDRAIDSRLVLADALATDLRNDADVKERLAAIEDQIVTQVYLERVVDAGVTEELMREQYDLAMAALPPTEEVLALHILVETEEEAKAIIAEIQAGADFATVAMEKSIGPSGPDGGDIGYITREAVVPEFGDAAFALEAGEMGAEPVKSEFGWHVIMIDDRRMSEQPSFESLRAEIADSITRDVITAHFEDLREAADLVNFNADGSPIEEAAAAEEEPAAEEKPPAEEAPAEDAPITEEAPAEEAPAGDGAKEE